MGGVLCHMLLQVVVCIAFVAQEAGQFQVVIGYLADNLQIVATVVVGTLGVVGQVEFMAQVAAVGILHEGYVAGSLQGEDPTFNLFLAGGLGGSFPDAFRQAGQLVGRGQYQLVVVVFLQVVLAELQGQQAQLLAEGSIAVAGFAPEVGTVAYKAAVGLFQQRLLFGGETDAVGVFMNVFHTFKETLVQADVVAVFTEHRHQHFGQTVQFVVGLGAV